MALAIPPSLLAQMLFACQEAVWQGRVCFLEMTSRRPSSPAGGNTIRLQGVPFLSRQGACWQRLPVRRGVACECIMMLWCA